MNTILDKILYFDANKYAWPGGYPMFALMADNGVLCYECFKENYNLIMEATFSIDNDSQWEIIDIFVNWEDTSLYCDNCNKICESAYGDE